MPPRSTFRRRWLMWTSTRFVSESRSFSHTLSPRWTRLTTSPARRISVSRMAYSPGGRRAAARDHVALGVEREVAYGEQDRPRQLGPAKERVKPGEELGERERLREVVVGSRVEAEHAVLDCVTRRQEQDRDVQTARPQAAADRDPVAIREQPVEHDR